MNKIYKHYKTLHVPKLGVTGLNFPIWAHWTQKHNCEYFNFKVLKLSE